MKRVARNLMCMTRVERELKKMTLEEFLITAYQSERLGNKNLQVLVAQEMLERWWRGEIKLSSLQKELA